MSNGERATWGRDLKRLIAQEESNLKYARDFLLAVKAAMFATVSFLLVSSLGD